LHIRCELKKGQEEVSKSASLGVGVVVLVALPVSRLILHTNVGDGGDIVPGNGRWALALALALAVDDDDDDGNILLLVRENLGLLLLLLLLVLLHTLNLELGFDDGDDDDDDSFEDPDSGPCTFPLPAFNGEAHFFLVVC
jgi:hypothetical protein